MGNLNLLKEGNPQACLTKGSYAGCHTRWRGLDSHLLVELKKDIIIDKEDGLRNMLNDPHFVFLFTLNIQIYKIY